MKMSPARVPYPYATLFRSNLTMLTLALEQLDQAAVRGIYGDRRDRMPVRALWLHPDAAAAFRGGATARAPACGRAGRSEEHTSELQSHVNLVCRLLLEKIK